MIPAKTVLKFKNKGNKTEVFRGDKLIGTLDRIKDLVNARYYEKPRYIYTVTKVGGSKEIFNSRQKAAQLLLRIGVSKMTYRITRIKTAPDKKDRQGYYLEALNELEALTKFNNQFPEFTGEELDIEEWS